MTAHPMLPDPGDRPPGFHRVVVLQRPLPAFCYWSAATVVGVPCSPTKTTSSLVAVSATLNA